MRSEWSPEELVESWTLLGDDWERVANKSGVTRLGFAILLKFFELEARFPRDPGEVPDAAVAYVAEQVGVPAARFSAYWEAVRAVTRYRAEIRGVFGFREATRADEETLAVWLAAEVCPVELAPDDLVDAVLVRCRHCGSSRRAGSSGSSGQHARGLSSASARRQLSGWARSARRGSKRSSTRPPSRCPGRDCWPS